MPKKKEGKAFIFQFNLYVLLSTLSRIENGPNFFNCTPQVELKVENICWNYFHAKKQRVTALNKWITRRAYQLAHLLLMNKEKRNQSLFEVSCRSHQLIR